MDEIEDAAARKLFRGGNPDQRRRHAVRVRDHEIDADDYRIRGHVQERPELPQLSCGIVFSRRIRIIAHIIPSFENPVARDAPPGLLKGSRSLKI
jgi:hypothetical protein